MVRRAGFLAYVIQARRGKVVGVQAVFTNSLTVQSSVARMGSGSYLEEFHCRSVK